MSEEADFGKSLWTLVLSLAALLGLLFFGAGPAAPQDAQPPPPAVLPEANDLGAQLYNQAQDPIAGKLPDTIAPVTNPLDGIYKNPFE